MLKNVVTFDRDTRDFVLDSLDKAVDDDGYIVEKKDKTKRVLGRDGEFVKARDLAAVKKGSFVFFKSDLPSLISLSDILE